MAGHVNNTDFHATGEGKPGKAEFDGHFPGFFFRQTVRVNTCQSVNQRGFTVVNMTGCADDEQCFTPN
jgi:hypothetical protein